MKVEEATDCKWEKKTQTKKPQWNKRLDTQVQQRELQITKYNMMKFQHSKSFLYKRPEEQQSSSFAMQHHTQWSGVLRSSHLPLWNEIQHTYWHTSYTVGEMELFPIFTHSYISKSCVRNISCQGKFVGRTKRLWLTLDECQVATKLFYQSSY